MILKNLPRQERLGSRNKCLVGGCPYGQTKEGYCDLHFAQNREKCEVQAKDTCSRYEHEKMKSIKRRNGKA